MFTSKLSWVNTSSTSPRQQSYAAALCVVFTAAVCAKSKTATSTCIWTPWPTASTVGMAGQRSQASLMRQRRWGSRQSSSASATAASRESTASGPTCPQRPPNCRRWIFWFYWFYCCTFVNCKKTQNWIFLCLQKTPDDWIVGVFFLLKSIVFKNIFHAVINDTKGEFYKYAMKIKLLYVYKIFNLFEELRKDCLHFLLGHSFPKCQIPWFPERVYFPWLWRIHWNMSLTIQSKLNFMHFDAMMS